MRTAALVFAIIAIGVVNLVANYHWHQQDADALAKAQATQQATWQMAVIDRQAACSTSAAAKTERRPLDGTV